MTKYLTYLIKKERRVLRNSFLQQSYSINDIMQWMVTSVNMRSELLTELSSRFSSRNEFSKLRKPNISETGENEKFGNFRLTQGLNGDVS